MDYFLTENCNFLSFLNSGSCVNGDIMWAPSPVTESLSLTESSTLYDEGSCDDYAESTEQLFAELQNSSFSSKLLNEPNAEDLVEIISSSSACEDPTSPLQDNLKNNIPTMTSAKKQAEVLVSSDDDDCEASSIENHCHSSKQTNKSMRNKKQPLSRNAITARKNREKKKKYISDLESKLQRLTADNKKFKTDYIHLKTTCEELKYEVKYLRSVLANESKLSHILNAVSLSSGLVAPQNTLEPPLKRKKYDSDHTYATELVHQTCSTKNSAETAESAGICLHISSGIVSLEMCHKCNSSHGNAFE